MAKLKEIVLDGMVFPVSEDSNEERIVEHEIGVKSSIKLNGEDPFRFGRPLILNGNVDKNFEAWNDKDILIFLGRNNAITLLQKNEVHKIAVKLDIV